MKKQTYTALLIACIFIGSVQDTQAFLSSRSLWNVNSIAFGNSENTESSKIAEPDIKPSKIIDNCCREEKSMFDSMVKSHIQTLAPWKQPILTARFDTMRIYPGVWTDYVQTDSTAASKQYDLFITKTLLEQNPWKKIQETLRMVYETARDGDYNTEVLDFLKSGKQKYIAFSMDRAAGDCGQYANFTRDVLTELGVLSGTLGFTITDVSGEPIGGHVVPAVIIQKKLYLLDPMFCQYYSTKNSESPLDFVTMRGLIMGNKNSSIVPVKLPHGSGHGLGMGDTQFSCTFDTSICRYRISDNLIRDDGPPDIFWSNPINYSIAHDEAIARKGLLPDYYSMFGFSVSIEGNKIFEAEAAEILKAAKIDFSDSSQTHAD